MNDDSLAKAIRAAGIEEVILGFSVQDLAVAQGIILSALARPKSVQPEAARTAWTVEKCYDYEGCDVVGVYSSKEEADAAVIEFRKEYDYADDWRVTEFAVPTSTPTPQKSSP